MISPRKYKPRSLDFLTDRLKSALNRLQMRDWQVDLVYGDNPPECLAELHTSAGTSYQTQYLRGTIWISPKRCKQDNLDPLENLYHEIFHIWLNYCDDEERQCNILASILV